MNNNLEVQVDVDFEDNFMSNYTCHLKNFI